MDLALEFGQPVSVLSRVLHERELRQWYSYAGKKILPARRIELYLAQIALLIARTMGNARNAKLTDFLFDRPSKAEKEAMKPAAIAFFGVRRLGQGRKPKDDA